MPARQAALPRLPLDPNGRRCHGAETEMRPGDGPQCRRRSHRPDKRSLPGSAETAAGWLRAVHRARPTGTGGGPHEYRRKSSSWKSARFPQGSGKPYGAIGERGFPPPAPLACGSLRPRPRRPHGAAAGKRSPTSSNRHRLNEKTIASSREYLERRRHHGWNIKPAFRWARPSDTTMPPVHFPNGS